MLERDRIHGHDNIIWILANVAEKLRTKSWPSAWSVLQDGASCHTCSIRLRTVHFRRITSWLEISLISTYALLLWFLKTLNAVMFSMESNSLCFQQEAFKSLLFNDWIPRRAIENLDRARKATETVEICCGQTWIVNAFLYCYSLFDDLKTLSQLGEYAF